MVRCRSALWSCPGNSTRVGERPKRRAWSVTKTRSPAWGPLAYPSKARVPPKWRFPWRVPSIEASVAHRSAPRRVMMFTTPPRASEPWRVDMGPRITSIRSMAARGGRKGARPVAEACGGIGGSGWGHRASPGDLGVAGREAVD
jgi:hypothetical protein